MGAAYYICVDRLELNVETAVDGKALSRAIDQLADVRERLDLRPLNDFFGMSSDEVEDLLGEEIELVDDQRNAMWFDPDEGISYFGRLAEYLRSHPTAIADSEAVIEDLEDLLRTLHSAKAASARWHLAIDI